MFTHRASADRRRASLRGWTRCIAFYATLLLVTTMAIPVAWAQGVSIHTLAIEIDKNANYTPGDGDANIWNPGATDDWVRDILPNVDVDPDSTDSIAVGIVPGVTGATGGTGHWNGVRIVDGVAGDDQDIFLTGGKENDTSSWTVGPGSVGSSKYDITQAYLANDQDDIFFGMERRGNNGTTAFDFEFNQAAPTSIYVPNRMEGDVLCTFEMKGSGSSGSAVAYIYIWDGSAFVLTTPEGVYTSINTTTITPPPWGYVNSGGEWILAPVMPRFEFAEATVPLSILPNVDACGGTAYVQVRTRSSATPNSDLKDTTKIFEYSFGGATAAGALTRDCALLIGYDATGSLNSSGTTTGLTYSWQFQKNSANDGSGSWSNVGVPATDAIGSLTASSPGLYRAILTVTDSLGCTDDVTTNSVLVFSQVTGGAELTPDCDETFAYSAYGSGGTGSYDFGWTIQKFVDSTWVTAYTFEGGPSTTSSGLLDVDDFETNGGDGLYRAVVLITDAQDCATQVTSNEIEVAHALNPTIAKTGANATTNTVTVAVSGDMPEGATFQWQRKASGEWVDIDGATASTLSYSTFDADTTPASITFSIGSTSFVGLRWDVQVRVHVSRMLNGAPCTGTSSALTLSKVRGVDP